MWKSDGGRGRAEGADGQWMGSASKGGPGHLCRRSYVVARESSLQGLQPHTVVLGLKRPTEVRSACWTHKYFGWMGCAKVWAHTYIHIDFQLRADENRLIQSLPGQWIGTGYDTLKVFSILRNLFPSLRKNFKSQQESENTDLQIISHTGSESLGCRIKCGPRVFDKYWAGPVKHQMLC